MDSAVPTDLKGRLPWLTGQGSRWSSPSRSVTNMSHLWSGCMNLNQQGQRHDDATRTSQWHDEFHTKETWRRMSGSCYQTDKFTWFYKLEFTRFKQHPVFSKTLTCSPAGSDCSLGDPAVVQASCSDRAFPETSELSVTRTHEVFNLQASATTNIFN